MVGSAHAWHCAAPHLPATPSYRPPLTANLLTFRVWTLAALNSGFDILLPNTCQYPQCAGGGARFRPCNKTDCSPLNWSARVELGSQGLQSSTSLTRHGFSQ